MNINDIRQQFPVLDQQVYGKPLVYLDNAATTQKPLCVLEHIENSYRHKNANVHRGTYLLSQEATAEYEEARKVVADFINAASEKEIIFTRGATESLNLLAFCIGETFCDEGDEIIISTMEHHSNIVPWQLLAQRKNLKIKVIPISEQGVLDLDAYQNLLSERTKVVAITHLSNVLGTINPIKKMTEMAHKYNAMVVVDGAQSIAHLKVDIRDLDADFFAFSGHKVYAPTGIGVLYGKKELLEQLTPYQSGGEMIKTVTWEETTFNDVPYKFEAGTPNYIGATALAVALQYINRIGREEIEQEEKTLLAYMTNRLKEEINGIRIIGESEEKCGVLSFLVKDIHPYDLGVILDKCGIAVRVGHHCAQPLMDFYGIPGTVRASLGIYNAKEDIDQFVTALKKTIALF